jgi:hypothetical protein
VSAAKGCHFYFARRVSFLSCADIWQPARDRRRLLYVGTTGTAFWETASTIAVRNAAARTRSRFALSSERGSPLPGPRSPTT